MKNYLKELFRWKYPPDERKTQFLFSFVVTWILGILLLFGGPYFLLVKTKIEIASAISFILLFAFVSLSIARPFFLKLAGIPFILLVILSVIDVNK
jgi:hypothetical protein